MKAALLAIATLRARSIDLSDHHGPEEIALGHDGRLYATSANGLILQTDTDGSLIVANAFLGLQRVHSDGSVESLLNEVNGRALVYANDLAIAADGAV